MSSTKRGKKSNTKSQSNDYVVGATRHKGIIKKRGRFSPAPFSLSAAVTTVHQVAASERNFLAALLAPPEEAPSAGNKNHRSLALRAILVRFHFPTSMICDVIVTKIASKVNNTTIAIT
jgi:hypothetical protein